MKALKTALVLAFGMSTAARAIDYQHTARGARPAPQPEQVLPAPSPAPAPAAQIVPAPTPAVAPAAVPLAETPVTGPGCVDCNQSVGVKKAVHVSVPETAIQTQVHQVLCTKLTYQDEQYQSWEPQQYRETEKYVYQVSVPYLKSGTYTATGYKPVSTSQVVKYPVYDRCGNFCGYRTREEVSTVLKPYTYTKDYTYTEYKSEQRVGSQDVSKIKMVPVTKSRQIARVVPDAKYIESVTHQATYTVTTSWQSEVPKAEGERLYKQQQEAAGQKQLP